MGIIRRLRLRVKRQRYKARAFRKRRELRCVADRTSQIGRGDVLLFCTARNEDVRLPYFLKYYRNLGVNHFLFVDNDSTDGSLDYLSQQEDVSIWHTTASYKRSRFGMDWINHLLWRYGNNHWTLVVDPDEFFVYPFCDTRPINALTDWLDASGVRSFSAMLLDMYPKGPIGDVPYKRGDNPFETALWFDSGNYTLRRNHAYHELWIQGGPRARAFFADHPEKAPALNKIPLVKWSRRNVYLSSTHALLPRGLNHVYEQWGGEKPSGALLHAKFLSTFNDKAREELKRRQHYAASMEYRAYVRKGPDSTDLWCRWSERYINWRQLEILGLMSKGNWA